jgi:hypothetical protein
VGVEHDLRCEKVVIVKKNNNPKYFSTLLGGSWMGKKMII